MKDALGRWIVSQRIPLLISCSFAFLGSLLYFVAGYARGGGRLGAWYILYYISWPASWVANQITSRLDGHIPDRLFEFLYVAGIIMAGMLWFFLIAVSVKCVMTKMKPE